MTPSFPAPQSLSYCVSPTDLGAGPLRHELAHVVHDLVDHGGQVPHHLLLEAPGEALRVPQLLMGRLFRVVGRGLSIHSLAKSEEGGRPCLYSTALERGKREDPPHHTRVLHPHPPTTVCNV